MPLQIHSIPCRCRTLPCYAIAVLFSALPLHSFSFPTRRLSGLFTAATPQDLAVPYHCLSTQYHSFTQQFRAYPLRCHSVPVQDKSIRCQSNTELYPYSPTRCHSLANLLISIPQQYCAFPSHHHVSHCLCCGWLDFADAIPFRAIPSPFLSQPKLFNASTLRHFAKLNLCFTLLLCTNPQHCYSSKCFSITPPDYADRNLTMPSPFPTFLFLYVALLFSSVAAQHQGTPLLHTSLPWHSKSALLHALTALNLTVTIQCRVMPLLILSEHCHCSSQPILRHSVLCRHKI